MSPVQVAAARIAKSAIGRFAAIRNSRLPANLPQNADLRHPASRSRRVFIRVFALACGPCSRTRSEATSADSDLQLWAPVQFIQPVGEAWTLSLQTELRLKDDISETDELIYKPAVNYHFNPTWAVSIGYKYIENYQKANEQDVWQELHFNKNCNDLVTGLQLRLEERFIDDIDGVIPRLRVLEHISHPIGDSPWYLTGFGALRFNLDNKGQGPVSGFEQSRIYAALGRHFGDRVQGEFGYLWRYERERTSEDKSDHVLHFQLVFNNRVKPARKPATRDRYR